MDIPLFLPLSRNSLGLAILLPCFIIAYYMLRSQRSKLADFPVVGKRDSADFRAALEEGCRMYPDSAYILPTPIRPTVILPATLVDEVIRQPEDVLATREEVDDRFLAKYTLLTADDHMIRRSVNLITRNVSEIMNDIAHELDLDISKALNVDTAWKSTNIHTAILQLVAQINSRVFVGLELSQNVEWVDAIINYTVQVMIAVQKLLEYPTFLHSVVQYLLPEIRTIHQSLASCCRLLQPVLDERKQNLAEPFFKKPKDMIQGVIDYAPEGRGSVLEFQGRSQMILGLASTHTTSITLENALYDLAANPQCLQPLRDELEKMIEQDGGNLLVKSFTMLRKMDSFLRESQRMNPVDLLSLRRKTKVAKKFCDGTKVPAGTSIAIPVSIVRNDGTLTNPDVFDAFRFQKLGDAEGNLNKYLYVNTDANSLGFGHGVHACPGRFFAAIEVKLILAHILLHYDIKFADGIQRPKTTYYGTNIGPNLDVEIMLRKRVKGTS
ncbi:cytochrome P450 [Periconia macrospinosa]|uniref:Cytochrome P450 n=1 Tax=Periconia macrospinosa TaxID=97972 RepID=A0A2V1DGZ1_9PLEO|nr:cytochrome P450 [Periconia macrospinosa]